MKKTTKELIDLVKIPSISHGNKNKKDLLNILKKISKTTKKYGFKTKIIETKGNPVFVGILETGKKKPWLTIYNHLDVQPAKEKEWKTNPFKPIVKQGKVIGRGTTDDKGPALTIIHAINFLKKYNYEMPNIQLIYETEEEIGSPNFGSFLKKNKLKTPDSILISDTLFQGKNPSLTYRLRGIQVLELELETGKKELHSGVLGNAVKNPLNILIDALSKCVDEKRNVLIPGFYDNVKKIKGRELKELKNVAKRFSLKKFKDDTKAELYEENPLKLLFNIWYKPSFEIHGFEGIQYEPNVIKTSIPNKVKAKVTIRLVPGQKPKEIVKKLQKHVKKIHPKIKVITLDSVEASVTDINNKFMVKAKEACKYGFNLEPLFVATGGTIGSVHHFQKAYKKPIILIAQSLLSDGYHAPNEYFSLKQAEKGIKTMAKYINSIADFD